MKLLARVSLLCALLVLAGVQFAFALVDPLPTPVEMQLRGVSFSGTSNGWAVGDGILHTDNGGLTWYRQFSPRERLNAVDFVSPTHGFAVGDSGAVLRTIDGGANWVARSTGKTAHFYGVDFVDSSYGWVVGDGGLVLRTTDGGTTWAAAAVPSARKLNAVSFVNRTTGWVCGPSMVAGDGFNDLYIAKTTDGGATWIRTDNGAYLPGGSDDMWSWDDIDFVSTTTGWVAGGLPGVRKTTDGAATWDSQLISGGTIDFVDTSRGVCVTGTASYSTDGGASWLPGDLPGLLPWQDVCMASADEVWCVAGGPDDIWDHAGMIAHSTDGGAHWTADPSSTGNVHFLGGSTRYHTAANIARMTNAASPTVVLATGRNYPDALSASGLAGALNGVLLLTDTTLPSVVESAIADLGTTHVVIVGGPGAVSSAIQTQLEADYTVERIGGADRFETAANVARRIVAEGGSEDEVMVANGGNFADAASASAVAYNRRMPILLVRPDVLPPATAEVIDEMAVNQISVIGGPAAVNDDIVSALTERILPGGATRVASGANRYDTSAKLAQWAIGRGWFGMSNTGIATGKNFPDALAGGVMAGSYAGPMLLTDPTQLSPEIEAQVGSAPVDNVWIMNDRGGAAVRDAVATRLAYVLAH